MLVAMLQTKTILRAQHIFGCFAEGLRVHGDDTVVVSSEKDLRRLDDADVSVQICLPNFTLGDKPIDRFRVAAWNRMRARGKRSLVIDTGFIRNQYDAVRRTGSPKLDLDDRSTYAAVDDWAHYEIAYEGIKGLGDHCIHGDEPQDRWDRLGTRLLPWRKVDGPILLLTQPLFGQSSQETNVLDWYATVFAELQDKHPGIEIKARAHPRTYREGGSSRTAGDYRREVEKRLRPRQKLSWYDEYVTLETSLDRAAVAIAYSTTAGVTAVCRGVPTVVGSPACMATPVADRDVSRALRAPRHAERQAWANALAYSQWTCKEMRNGTAWSHYRPHALLPRTGGFK